MTIADILEMLDLFYALKHYFDRLKAQEYRKKAQASNASNALKALDNIAI